MSKYDEICQASADAARRWIQYRDRSWGYLAGIVSGLATHCGIPREKITFLRSNDRPGDERRYSPPEDGGRYTLAGAVSFDQEDEYWHLGVAITLSPSGSFPERWVGVIFCVTEDESQAVVKLGSNGKPQVIDFTDARQCAEFYDRVAELLKNQFDNPRKISKQIGFVAEVNPQQGEKQDRPATTGR